MCDCTSCKTTDAFAKKSFSDWPRGNPAGKSADRDYAAHVAHSKRMSERAFSDMELRLVAEPRFPAWISRSMNLDPHGKYKFFSADVMTTAEYVREWEKLNGLRAHGEVRKSLKRRTA